MSLPDKFKIIIPPQDINENKECLQQIAKGNREAFEWLYKNYCKRLYDYLLLLSADISLAEDCVQEIFLKIWTSRDKLRTVNNFNSYLFMIARNHLINHWKKQQMERSHLQQYKQQQPIKLDEYLLEKKELYIQTQQAIHSLPKQQQTIYRLIREEEKTREEVSHTLNISPFTVKCTMQKALQKLRKKLKKVHDLNLQ